MWPFKREKTEVKIPDFKGVKFGNRLYDPAKDITAHEVAILLPLFITSYPINRQSYINKHNLQRHFKESLDE
jgi:hypothetical protein